MHLHSLSWGSLSLWVHKGVLASDQRTFEVVAGVLTAPLSKALVVTIDRMKNSPDHGLSVYAIEFQGQVVGTIGSKGIDGDSIWISYGVSSAFQGQGIATHALSLFVEEVGKKAGIKYLRAETEISNRASQRVLEKNGFTQEKSAQLLEWKLNLTK